MDPSMNLSLHIGCRGLKKMDALSKSDPMAVLYSIDNGNKVEIGRTETVKNATDVDFERNFVVVYKFERQQDFLLEVYDIDGTDIDLSKHDLIGSHSFRLSQLMGSCRGSATEKLTLPGKDTSRGTITINAEEIKHMGGIVHFRLAGAHLDKKDFFGKSDPYLKIYRQHSSGTSWNLIHTTETVMKTLDPHWKPFEISLQDLCNGDERSPIKIECFDYDKSNDDDLIGILETSFDDFRAGNGLRRELIHPDKTHKSRYTNSGELIFESVEVEKEYTFLDYLRSGLQMNFTVAIDFTGSNGSPREASSLHYYQPPIPNAYVTAIQSVGTVLEDYDSDKMFPAFGFGAKLPDGVVSHNFALNGNPQNPFCAGVPGILAAYSETLSRVSLYGPTNFAPVINSAARIARDSAQHPVPVYSVLMIITDGAITDMAETTKAIVLASGLPLSIVIVGVGDADFDSMNALDGDSGELMYQGRPPERDIVQFVPFNAYASDPATLAAKVLEEIPHQFVSYMRKKGVVPTLAK